MIKHIFKLLIIGGLAVPAFTGCSKDLGNYEYNDANTITITTDMANVDPSVVINNDSVVVKQNDSLKIDILLSQTKASADLAFEWTVVQTAATLANPVQYVLSNKQQLRTKIILAPNLYKLVVKVTDKTTGVSFYKFYMLNVDTSPWGGEGWLVLQDQPSDGGCDVAIITTRDGVNRGTVYKDIYFLANNRKLPTGTRRMAVMNYNSQLRIQKLAFFYPNGGLQVRSTDYLDSSNHTNWFLQIPSTINVQANAVAPVIGQYELLLNNGQLYSQAVNATSIKTPPITYGAPIVGSWTSLSPFFLINGSGIYSSFFDQANRCFLHLNLSNNTLIPSTQADIANQHWPAYSGAAANLHPVTGRGYDLNNIRLNMIYAENAQTYNGLTEPAYYCIFRNNNNDSTFVYQYTTGSAGIANNIATGRYFLKDATTNVPGINAATVFAVPAFSSSSASGVFYYVHGTNKNAVYVCRPSYTGTMPATTTASLGYSFPAGTVVTAMKVFKSGHTTANLPLNEGRVLVVATDETATGKGHNVYFFNLSATGDITATPNNVYTGFDKIVDIAYKKGLGL